jgi:hypothetical protein
MSKKLLLTLILASAALLVPCVQAQQTLFPSPGTVATGPGTGYVNLGEGNGTLESVIPYTVILSAPASVSSSGVIYTLPGFYPSADSGFLNCNTTGACSFSPALQFIGTTFTASGCGTVTGLTGGATGGQFTIKSSTCVVVITMGDSLTAAHGWTCWASDETNNATWRETAKNANTATITFTGASNNDIADFGCLPF